MCKIVIFLKGAIILPLSDRAKENRKKATAKYTLKAYDRLEIKVKKGCKEELKTYAAQRGESLNGFVNRAIQETIERDAQACEGGNI